MKKKAKGENHSRLGACEMRPDLVTVGTAPGLMTVLVEPRGRPRCPRPRDAGVVRMPPRPRGFRPTKGLTSGLRCGGDSELSLPSSCPS